MYEKRRQRQISSRPKGGTGHQPLNLPADLVLHMLNHTNTNTNNTSNTNTTKQIQIWHRVLKLYCTENENTPTNTNTLVLHIPVLPMVTLPSLVLYFLVVHLLDICLCMSVLFFPVNFRGHPVILCWRRQLLSGHARVLIEKKRGGGDLECIGMDAEARGP